MCRTELIRSARYTYLPADAVSRSDAPATLLQRRVHRSKVGSDGRELTFALQATRSQLWPHRGAGVEHYCA